MFALWTALLGSIALPSLATPSTARWVANLWAKGFLWLLAQMGVSHRCEGKLPKGSYLLVAQHQSVWETIALFAILNQPCYVMKSSLFYIPIVGLFLRRLGMIGINRSKPIGAIRKLTNARLNNRSVVMFPQGTRSAKNPTIKNGAWLFYKKLPLVVATLNSGKVMPARSFCLYKGTATIKFQTGFSNHLTKTQFTRLLRNKLTPK